MSFFWATGTPVGFLVTSPLGFKVRVCSALFSVAETNVIYVPWDPPLLLHFANLLTISIMGTFLVHLSQSRT